MPEEGSRKLDPPPAFRYMRVRGIGARATRSVLDIGRPFASCKAQNDCAFATMADMGRCWNHRFFLKREAWLTGMTIGEDRPWTFRRVRGGRFMRINHAAASLHCARGSLIGPGCNSTAEAAAREPERAKASPLRVRTTDPRFRERQRRACQTRRDARVG